MLQHTPTHTRISSFITRWRGAASQSTQLQRRVCCGKTAESIEMFTLRMLVVLHTGLGGWAVAFGIRTGARSYSLAITALATGTPDYSGYRLLIQRGGASSLIPNN